MGCQGQGHSDLKWNFLIYTLKCANIVRSLQKFQIITVQKLSWMSLNMGIKVKCQGRCDPMKDCLSILYWHLQIMSDLDQI